MGPQLSARHITGIAAVAALLLVGVLSGCSSKSDPTLEAAPSPAAGAQPVPTNPNKKMPGAAAPMGAQDQAPAGG